MTTDGGGWTVLFMLGSFSGNPASTCDSTHPNHVARWGYAGTATTTYINEVDSSGDYSQPALWGTTFSEWSVGSPTQGFIMASMATAFDQDVVLASYSAPSVSSGAAYSCASSTCTAIPGTNVVWHIDNYHFAFNYDSPGSSPAVCRFSALADQDVSWNDVVGGLMCINWDSQSCSHHTLDITGGYRLMARM